MKAKARVVEDRTTIKWGKQGRLTSHVYNCSLSGKARVHSKFVSTCGEKRTWDRQADHIEALQANDVFGWGK